MCRANTRQQTDNWVAHGNRWTDIDITIRKLCRRESKKKRKKDLFYQSHLADGTEIRTVWLFHLRTTSVSGPRHTQESTLNPRLFVPVVVQRAVRVVPSTADVFPNCLRQRLRELTRHNHLLLAPRSSTIRTNSPCWGCSVGMWTSNFYSAKNDFGSRNQF